MPHKNVSVLSADDVPRLDEQRVQDAVRSAFRALAEGEGILCAFESAHALAHALKLARAEPESAILVGLSGRGDKDVAQAQQLLRASA